ncbi:hypothetical protein ACIRRH_32780 [Kitasatospora sp. NPDC101235]|uniref:hypothetical protein n=1 Tax=Kitasatospora sp. NPDC101235 TaxID=3364101 RepID=UPI00380D0FA1
MPTRCEEITRDVCTNFEAESEEFNGEHDHVRRPAGRGAGREGRYRRAAAPGQLGEPVQMTFLRWRPVP